MIEENCKSLQKNIKYNNIENQYAPRCKGWQSLKLNVRQAPLLLGLILVFGQPSPVLK